MKQKMYCSALSQWVFRAISFHSFSWFKAVGVVVNRCVITASLLTCSLSVFSRETLRKSERTELFVGMKALKSVDRKNRLPPKPTFSNTRCRKSHYTHTFFYFFSDISWRDVTTTPDHGSQLTFY